MTDYTKKYIKYKNKFLNVRQQRGNGLDPIVLINENTLSFSQIDNTIESAEDLQKKAYKFLTDTINTRNLRAQLHILRDLQQLANKFPNIEKIEQLPAMDSEKPNYVHALVTQIPDSNINKQKLLQQLFNTARVCWCCSKPLGPSVETCNRCSANQKTPDNDKSKVVAKYTKCVSGTIPSSNDEIKNYISSNLVLFLYRFSYGDSPNALFNNDNYKLLLSHPFLNRDKDILVYDDALKLAYVHLNAIPFNMWIPDIAMLFSNPQEGQKLIEKLHGACVENALNIILEKNPTLISQIDKVRDAILLYGMAGFNYPPSENQLHLQFLVLPFLSTEFTKMEQKVELTKKAHFTKNRFVFYDHLYEALTLAITNEPFRQLMMGKGITDANNMVLFPPIKGQNISVKKAQQYFNKYYELMRYTSAGSPVADNVTYDINIENWFKFVVNDRNGDPEYINNTQRQRLWWNNGKNLTESSWKKEGRISVAEFCTKNKITQPVTQLFNSFEELKKQRQ